MIISSHYGQHEDCFACKLQSLSLHTGAAAKHQHQGDPWDGNPVKERIEELRREGRRVEAFELSKEQ